MSQQRPARKLPSLLVDPAEETVRRRCRDPINVEGLLPSKIRINLEDNVQYVSMRKALKVKRPRFDVSLVYLTRKFMDLVRSAPGGILDLNKVATKLGVRKRRVYDITNVLDGIDLVEKKSKNHIRWIGSDLSNFGAVPQQKKLQEELSDLSAMEDALDELIKDCAQQLFKLTDDKENERLAYVTYQDIHSIQAFHEQIVIAVKAPAETRLDVPAPRENGSCVVVRRMAWPTKSTVLPHAAQRYGQPLAEWTARSSAAASGQLSGFPIAQKYLSNRTTCTVQTRPGLRV
ncbi:transcription factor E2F6 isoform X2 [Orcinus orca]|uniref:transcription factor E2F6 isoform X2 n=1 Tax=Orcinus orca TaxID=9733 RepID=UPI0014419A0A|nr:transcription factor E2F6 isoform X2 [Orcinus orca]XP_033293325.1 transcription factor E2F6 isoform X2 [Orcinus orca]